MVKWGNMTYLGVFLTVLTATFIFNMFWTGLFYGILWFRTKRYKDKYLKKFNETLVDLLKKHENKEKAEEFKLH
jgi:hypothetical protein